MCVREREREGIGDSFNSKLRTIRFIYGADGRNVYMQMQISTVMNLVRSIKDKTCK